MAGTIADLLRLHARTRPHHEAVVSPAANIDYRALDRMVDGLCHRLHAAGVRAGALVGLSLPDDLRHLVSLLAVIRLGAVILPLDRRWSRAERLDVAARFDASFVLSDEADGPANWMHLADAVPPASTASFAASDVELDAPMVLSLSSGTTGVPKGPRLTHRQLISRFMVYWIDIGLGSRDRFAVATPLFFGGGRAFALSMIYAGGTICLFPPPFEPAELRAFVAASGATAMFLVPTQLRRLLAEPPGTLAFPGLRALISSGSVLFGSEAEAVIRRLSPELYQYYASTEAGGVTLLTPNELRARPGSVGRPCFGVQVEVVDEADRPVPPGTLGRLRYRSPASPVAYHVGEAAGAFRDGFFYPGDLARFDAEGFLTLQGRAKDMIIRGGVNIHPSDIEQVLLDLPQVCEAAVTGVPSAELGEEVAAFIVAAGQLTAAEVRAACAARLARYKVPKTVVFLDALPKNSAGKIVKSALPELLALRPKETA
ncbi:MAG: AMP-binding protein [Acetobacteraceae bacterium]